MMGPDSMDGGIATMKKKGSLVQWTSEDIVGRKRGGGANFV